MGRVLRQERAAVGTTETGGGHPTGVHLSENRLRCDKGKQKGVLQRNWRERLDNFCNKYLSNENSISK